MSIELVKKKIKELPQGDFPGFLGVYLEDLDKEDLIRIIKYLKYEGDEEKERNRKREIGLIFEK